MDLVIEALVFVVQLALAGFLAWGGWLCLRHGRAGSQAPVANASGEETKTAAAFERVASLVLLALLFASVPGVLR